MSLRRSWFAFGGCSACLEAERHPCPAFVFGELVALGRVIADMAIDLVGEIDLGIGPELDALIVQLGRAWGKLCARDDQRGGVSLRGRTLPVLWLLPGLLPVLDVL